MKIKEIEKILVNKKLDNGNEIIISKRYDDFSVFTVKDKIDFGISGKITKNKIELYGVGDDMVFEATKECIDNLLKIINHSLNNAYVINFYDEKKTKVSTLAFVNENLIEFDQIKEICKNELKVYDYIKFAICKSAKYCLNYEFSF